jgi:hypothetical protein
MLNNKRFQVSDFLFFFPDTLRLAAWNLIRCNAQLPHHASRLPQGKNGKMV